MEEELVNTELDLDALRSEAESLFENRSYKEALDRYLKLYDFIPNDYFVRCHVATCYYNLGNHENAIKYYKLILDYNDVTDVSKLYNLYFWVGICYYFKSEPNYQAAKECFLKCIRISTENRLDFDYIGWCYFYVDDLNKAAEFFVKSKVDILQIKRYLNNNDLISQMLDYEVKSANNSTLFSKAMSDGGIEDMNSKEYIAYKDIYIKVLEIVALLYVNDINEKSVAHYTRINIAEQLIFNDSPFRLNTILTANDPKEGLDLFEFLDLNEIDNDVSNDFQAFIGSFTFNHDSLNQFRLYGKENDKEATGISLVLSRSFFNVFIKNSVNLFCVLDDGKTDKIINDKKPLFRCIYVDPVSKQLISIGHREKWTFYRENREHIEKADQIIKSYQAETDKIFVFVKDGLNKLKDLINKLENKKVNVLSELLLMLRYLTKNMAFKEEQECRIVTIENITDNPNILPKKEDGDFSQMYIEYRTVKDCIEKVYFAPKVRDKEMFNIQIKRFGLNIRSHQSTHKIS